MVLPCARHAIAMISLAASVCTFCPLGGACDEAVMQRLVGKESLVHHLVIDGALLKVADYAKQILFPNAVLSIRDPTHFIRTAIEAPMEHTGNFAKQHEALFGNRHAYVVVN